MWLSLFNIFLVVKIAYRFMSNFRTSSVFKFTKEYELLEKMIENGIIPNYCGEDLSFDSQRFYVGVPMSSFCDIPLTRLKVHTGRYGEFALALSKEWAIQKGLTPIMYIANDVVLESVYFHYQENQKVVDRYNRPDVKKDLLRRAALSSFPLGDYARMLNTQTEHAINTHIIGYLKKYEGVYIDGPIINYEENEWRYLVPDENETKWFWSEDDYLKWRFPNGDKTVKKPSPSNALKNYTLTFSCKDVRHVLVSDDEFKSRLLDFIKGLTTIGGESALEDQRNVLRSKIITLKEIEEDF